MGVFQFFSRHCSPGSVLFLITVFIHLFMCFCSPDSVLFLITGLITFSFHVFFILLEGVCGVWGGAFVGWGGRYRMIAVSGEPIGGCVGGCGAVLPRGAALAGCAGAIAAVGGGCGVGGVELRSAAFATTCPSAPPSCVPVVLAEPISLQSMPVHPFAARHSQRRHR